MKNLPKYTEEELSEELAKRFLEAVMLCGWVASMTTDRNTGEIKFFIVGPKEQVLLQEAKLGLDKTTLFSVEEQ